MADFIFILTQSEEMSFPLALARRYDNATERAEARDG